MYVNVGEYACVVHTCKCRRVCLWVCMQRPEQGVRYLLNSSLSYCLETEYLTQQETCFDYVIWPVGSLEPSAAASQC